MRYALRPSWPPLLPFRQPPPKPPRCSAVRQDRPARVDPKVPQPGQQDKIFPLGSSWVAVSLNGKAFGGERPTFSLDDQLRARGFGGCNNYSATTYPLREQGMAVGPVRAHQEILRQGRDGIRAGLSRGLPHRRQVGHQRPDTHHQDPERRIEVRTLALMSHQPASFNRGEADQRFALFVVQCVYFAAAGSRFSTGENNPSAPFCMPTLRSWKAASVERWPIDTMVVPGSVFFSMR